MAANKECLVMILDVRQNVAKELKRNALKCAGDILKDKICSGRKDPVSFILMGAQPESFDDYHSSVSCPNIVHNPNFVVPSWNIFVDLIRFINEGCASATNDGDWLMAVNVAVQLLRDNADVLKVKKLRILLFHDFDAPNTNYKGFCELSRDIMECGIQLNVVSQNIQFIDNVETGQPQAVFRSFPKKPDYQVENEKYALKLVSYCNAKLYNFREAFLDITLIENKRPWAWNGDLTIGSQIRIKLAGIIHIKNVNNITLAACWGSEDETAETVIKFYNKGKEFQPEENDLIDAYMLGSTPVPLDEPMCLSNEPIQPGLKFLGFIKQDSIPNEYYSGDSHYLLIHQKGMQASAKMLDALVKALHKMRMCMLCWKVYSVKFNNPKIVLIHPNEIMDDRPASLSMVEIAYHAQHLFWNFPALETKKNRCTKEQLDAIDNLIDSMDLIDHGKLNLERETMQKDILPFDFLPHIYEQAFLDMLERKVLSEAAKHDEDIQSLVAEKNYEDLFWRVPEPIEQQAKQAANKVKNLFPLYKNVERPKTKSQKPTIDSSINKSSKNSQNQNMTDIKQRKVECVGSETPAEDFEILMKCEVLTVTNQTLRDVTFHSYAEQMFNIIWQLIFNAKDPVDIKLPKITEALKVIRKNCYEFHAIEDYNNWMIKLKERVAEEELHDFWSDCVVKEELGLCFIGEISVEEKEKRNDFYKMNTNDLCENSTVKLE